jgi:BirA family biotin operon repressor/biotin-[acetyl-CoA-carboxylase] ligase
MIDNRPRNILHFDTRHIGRRVLMYDSLPSTNDLAFALNEPGVAIVAEVQTAGRGQRGRDWKSRAGCSLLLSAIVAPPPELARSVILVAWAAVAVAKAIFDLTALATSIKWPNDLLLGSKKVCGILTEYQRHAIVGIGVNLNQTDDDFRADGLPEATSLALAAGSAFDPSAVLGIVLRKLDDEYERLFSGDRVALERDWKQRIGLLGRHVRIELSDGGSVSGRLKEMGFDGVELEHGDGAFEVLAPERVRHLNPA